MVTYFRGALILVVPGGAAEAPSGRPRRPLAVVPAAREVVQVSEAGFPVGTVRGVPVVTAPEEIDITNAGELRAALLQAAVCGGGAFAVDMTATWFCDTAGIHALVDAHKHAQAEGGRVVLAVSGRAVLRILALTGLDRVLAIFPSLDGALAQLPAGQAQPGPPAS